MFVGYERKKTGYIHIYIDGRIYNNLYTDE